MCAGSDYPRPHREAAERAAVQGAGGTQLHPDLSGPARHPFMLYGKGACHPGGEKGRIHQGGAWGRNQPFLSQQHYQQGPGGEAVRPDPDDRREHGGSAVLPYPQADPKGVLAAAGI